MTKDKKSAAELLRLKAEETLKSSTSKRVNKTKNLTEIDALKLIHELQVHQIELEMINDELLRSQADNKLIAQKYSNLFHFSPSVNFSLSREGNITELNTAVAKFLGKERSYLINSKLSSFISFGTLHIYINFLNRIFSSKSSKSIETCEVTLQTDNSLIYCRLTAYTAEDCEQCFLTATNITELKLVEEKLSKNLELFHSIIDCTADSIFVKDIDGKYLIFNHAAELFTGIKAEEILGKDDTHIFSAEQAIAIMNEDQNIIKDKKNVIFDTCLTNSNGINRTFISNKGPVFDKEGNILGLFGVSHDITGRKLEEEALLESEQKYRTLADSGLALIWTATPDKKCDFFNQVWLDYTGRTHEQEFGDGWTEGVHPEDLAQCFEIYSTAFDKHEKFNMVYRLRRYDGEYRWFIDNGQPRYNSHGEFIGYIGHCLDITQHVLKDKEILKLSQAVEQSPVIIIMTDLNGNFEYVNPAFQAITGYLLNEVIGKNANIIKSGKTNPAVYKDLWDTITVGNDWYGEWENKKKDGSFYIASVSITPIRDSSGNITNYLGVEQDITDRKHAEKEIQELNANLELKIAERTDQLEEALARLNKIANQVPGFVFQLEMKPDATFNFTYVSEGVFDILGVRPLEVIDVPLIGFTKIHPDDYAGVLDSLKSSAMSQLLWLQDFRVILNDGTILWLSGNAMPQKEADGSVIWHGLITDITNRKKEEEVLQRYQSLMELMSNSSPLGFLVVDNRSDDILYFNKRFCQIWGIEQLTDQMLKGELKNNDIIPYCLPVLTDIPTFAESCKPLQDEENRVVLSDEIAFTGNRSIHRYSTQMRGKEDEYFGRFYIFEDVTDRKKAESFENELLQLSIQMTGINSSEVPKAIYSALSKIGTFLAADRAYIFELNEEDDTMSNSYEWCNEGVEPEIGNLQNIPAEIFPMWMDTLKRHENIQIQSVKNLPESWKAEREILEPQGIQSLLVIPFLYNNILIGFVGLDNVKSEKSYNDFEIKNLRVWSNMLAGILNKHRIDMILDQTRQNYETFFNTIDDFLFVLDEQGQMIQVNNTVINRLGYTTDELIQNSVMMVHPPERREEAGRIVGEMLAGTSEFCPVPLLSKSGVYIPVETRVKAGFWNGKSVIFGVSKDISKIKVSEEKFHKAFRSNSALMAISEYASGIFIDVNESFLKSLGYSYNEIVGKSSVELSLYLDPDTRAHVIQKVKENEQVREIVVKFKTKSGSVLTGLFSAETIFVGDELCLLTVMVDITKRIQAEEEIIKARNDAERANFAKSEFLSRMSHELRTPLNSILGFAQLLEMDDLEQEQKKGVKHILTSGKHLLNMINEVLDISRIEAGKLSLSIESVNSTKLIFSIIDIIQPLAQIKSISLHFINFSKEDLFVEADLQRLNQVLLNLMDNAVKYNFEGGSVVVSNSVISRGTNGTKSVRISVADSGKGLSEEEIPKLFDPFERFGADKTPTEGTGLGLAVVKKLIDAMGGTVGVESTPGQGSSFWIELPLSLNYCKNYAKPEDETISPITTSIKAGTVLYIEDNLSNIELVEMILQSHHQGIHFISSTTGAQTVNLAKMHSPNIILLDLNLPDIHGREVLKQLKEDQTTKNIPVVIISADAMPNQLKVLLGEGANNFLTKPFDVVNFNSIIDEFISY